LAEVDDDLPGALVDRSHEFPLELGSRVEVDLAGYGDYNRAVVDSLGIHAKACGLLHLVWSCRGHPIGTRTIWTPRTRMPARPNIVLAASSSPGATFQSPLAG